MNEFQLPQNLEYQFVVTPKFTQGYIVSFPDFPDFPLELENLSFLERRIQEHIDGLRQLYFTRQIEFPIPSSGSPVEYTKTMRDRTIQAFDKIMEAPSFVLDEGSLDNISVINTFGGKSLLSKDLVIRILEDILRGYR